MKKLIIVTTCLIGLIAGALIFSNGKIFGHEHTPNQVWELDDNYHWHKCNACDKQLQKTAHELNTTEYKTNETYHWYECVCGHKGAEVAHNYNETTYIIDGTNHWYECVDCGHKKSVTAHELNITEYKTNETYHWYECVCGHKGTEVAHNYNETTYITDGTNHWYECVDCGHKKSVSAHELNTAEYKTNETYHWHECVCGHKGTEVAHNWNNGTIFEAATPTQNGVMLFACTDCGREKYEPYEYQIKTEMSNAEWMDALNFAGMENYRIEFFNAANLVMLQEKNGDVLYNVDYRDGEEEHYYVKENSNYYSYIKNTSNIWQRNNIEEGYYQEENLSNYLSDFINLYNQFEYNPVTKAYEASNITILKFDSEYKYDSVAIYFEESKLVKANLEQNDVILEVVQQNPHESLFIQAIELSGTIPSEILVGEFDLAGIKLLVTYQNGSTKIIDVTQNMLLDANVVNVVGQQEISVIYKHKTFTTTVNIISPKQEYYYASFDNALLAIETEDYANSSFVDEADAILKLEVIDERPYITLLANTEISSTLSFTKNLVLNLNGMQMVFTNSLGIIIEACNIVINGAEINSQMQISTTGSLTTLFNLKSGSLAINGGTYNILTSGAGTTNAPNKCINVEGGTLEVNGANIYVGDETGVLYGLDISADANVTIKNTLFLLEAKSGLNSYGINNYGTLKIENSTLNTYSDYTGDNDKKVYTRSSRVVYNYATATLKNCVVTGVHSGITTKGALFIDGGTYSGYGHGGIYFSNGGDANKSYVKNAVIQYCDMPTGYYADTVAGTNGAGFYIGGVNNITVYMDDCEFYGTLYPFVMRDSDTEINNSIYITNSRIREGYSRGIRTYSQTSNDVRIYIGFGNDFNKSTAYKKSNIENFIEEDKDYSLEFPNF